MIKFIFKLIILITPPPFVLCACPPNVNGTVSSNGVCYALYNNSLDWFHAEAACIKEGGNLANIPDAFTNSFISSYAKSILGFQNYWVGGLADSSGNYSYWEWIDYKSFKYTNWAPGQPVYTTPEYCLVQIPANGQWSAVTCYTAKPYMCEFSNSSSLCPPSWLHTTAFGGEKCLGFNKTAVSWSNALSICEEYGGVLISIHNSKQDQFYSAFISTLFDSVSNAWIGLYTVSNGTKYWIDSTPIDYTNYSSNEVGNYCYFKDYAVDFQWVPIDCQFNGAYTICEYLLN